MPLINTNDEFKEYVQISAALANTSLLPSVRVAERRFIAPLLGNVLYAALTAAYETAEESVSAITDDNLKALAAITQEALANLTMMLVVPRLSVQVSDTGVRRNETDSVKTAFQYQEQNLQESYGNAGFDALEDMLALLESNPDDAFADWQTSDSATNEKKWFISSATAFDTYYPIYRSRQTYLAIRYIMQRIENFQVAKIIGQGLFNDLKDNPGTETNEVLLNDYICPAIALLTIAKALSERAVAVSEKGVTVSFTAPDRNRPSREPAPSTAVNPMAGQLTTDANEYLSRMVDYIQANATDYPLYAEQTETSRLYNVNNTRRSGIYGI